MAIKELRKPVKNVSLKVEPKVVDQKAEKFISKGGTLAKDFNMTESLDDHRLTLRIPKWLMDKVDEKRKQRLGTFSRNLFILEAIEKATKK
ncbi:MAG TPA: hypothetical protein VKR53_09035 [Puia sp.]|nr:hypothetical protein [Puia sp.]